MELEEGFIYLADALNRLEEVGLGRAGATERLRKGLIDGALAGYLTQYGGIVSALSRQVWRNPDTIRGMSENDYSMIYGQGILISRTHSVALAEAEFLAWSKRGRAAEPLAASLRRKHADDRSEPSAQHKPKKQQPRFSPKELTKWLRRRVISHPEGAPAPTEKQQLAEASHHFGFTIPRDEFRAIRRVNVPNHWRKQGPRSKRAG